MKTALTIGGSDPSGGAGVQGDLKTFTVLGVYGMAALTAVTVQNTLGVKEKETLEFDGGLVRQQIDAVAGDIPVDAVKTGMLANAAIVDNVADALAANKLQPYVCDPVLFAKGGQSLLSEAAVTLMKRRLFAMATVITPNRREAAVLTGSDPAALTAIAAAKETAKKLAGAGARSVIIKGFASGNQMVDLYFDGREFLEFAAETQPKEKTHGSGCAFSAAITAGLANGLSLVDSIDQAKQLVTMAIQYSDGQGRGIAPINVLAFAPKKKK